MAVAADRGVGSLVRDSVPRPTQKLQVEHYANLPYLFFYSALSIPLFYAVGLLAQSRTDFAIADFWRFWVVHLWVEDFLELFTTIMVAYIFVLLGIVSAKTATRVSLPGYPAVFLRWRGRDDAPHVFQRHARHPHGTRSVLLRR